MSDFQLELLQDEPFSNNRTREDFTNKSKMVRAIGRGEEGKYCKDCIFFIRKNFHDKTYFKCEKSRDSNCSASDIRASWDACALFQEMRAK